MPSPSTGSRIAAIPPSGSALIDPLLGPTRWASGSLTFSFPDYLSTWSVDPGSGYGNEYSGREPWAYAFSPLSSYDRPLFVEALGKWSAVANISFTQVADAQDSVGDIRAAYTEQADKSRATAWAYFPAQTANGGDIWFKASGVTGTDIWTPGSAANFAVIHEIGHALGLKHPFEGYPSLPYGWDSQSYTVMSYSAMANNPASAFSFNPTTPMLLDILALQHIYGANWTSAAGNTTHRYTDATTYHETVWDAGGNDTIIYDGWLESWIDMNPGQGSTIGNRVSLNSNFSFPQTIKNVWLAYGVSIESATGGWGSDNITGNSLNNTLTGRTGDDYLNGGDGIDTAVFSGTRSQYTFQRNGTTIYLNGPDGRDTLVDVERLHIGSTKIALDLNGNAGQAYRLYQAAFNRSPDVAGLGYQINALDTGLKLSQVAANFIASPEFQQTYGHLNNQLFVTQLYRNVLHREPDSAGLAYHQKGLEVGRVRADVLAQFSESPENQAALVGLIQNGIVYV